MWALRHRNIGLHYYDARRARGAPWAKRATRAARGGERVGRKRRSTRAALSASLERPILKRQTLKKIARSTNLPKGSIVLGPFLSSKQLKFDLI